MSNPISILFIHCVYISGGLHHSYDALCGSLCPADPRCNPAWVNGRYQSLPPYRLQAAQQSWGEKAFMAIKPRDGIVNVFCYPSLFTSGVWIKQGSFRAANYYHSLKWNNICWESQRLHFFLPVPLLCRLLYMPFFLSWAHVCTVTLRVLEKFTKPPHICSSLVSVAKCCICKTDSRCIPLFGFS